MHVNHSCYDERISKFLNDNFITFEYFPRIKLSDKLTNDVVNYLIKRDIEQNNVIKNSFVLKSEILKGNISRSKILLKHLDSIFKTLRLNVEKPKMEIMKNGLPKIRDDAKERTIYFSTNYTSKYYVFVKPDSKNQPASRYLLYNNGSVLVKEYNTPEEIKNFNHLSGLVSD